MGERLTKDEAVSFINKKYPRSNEILSKTKWKLIVNAPYNPNTTYKTGNGLKDTIVNIEFKWYHSIYLKDYFYTIEPDSTSWIQTETVSETLNGNWWYQTSDYTVLFNLGFNYLNPSQSMKFNGTIEGNSMKGECTQYQSGIFFKFRGIKQ